MCEPAETSAMLFWPIFRIKSPKTFKKGFEMSSGNDLACIDSHCEEKPKTTEDVKVKNDLNMNLVKNCRVSLECLSVDRVTEIKANVSEFIEKLNENYPNSPYLRQPRRSKRRRSYSIDLQPPSKLIKTDSTEWDNHSTISDNSSSSSGYHSITSSTSNKRKFTKPPPNNNNEYKVEDVLAIDKVRGEIAFQVKWLGYPKSQNTWEPLSNVRDTEKFYDFLKRETAIYEGAIHEVVSEIKSKLDLVSPKNEKEMKKLLKDIEALDEVELQTNLLILGMVKLYEKANYPFRILKRTEKDLVIKHFKDMRTEQLTKIAEWSKMVNECEPSSRIKVVNEVDFDTPPDDFVYINKNIGGENVSIPETPGISCNCVDGCSWNKECCGKLMGSKFAYRTNGTLRIPVGVPIYECNSKCACSADCHNRVIQRGRQHKLIIFKTPDGRGWGVKTEKYIPEGHFVCEYTGEVITFDETERRGKEYDFAGMTYLFDLDFHNQDNNFTIDALKYGNVARFINHSCNPNLGIWAMWSDCQDTNFQRIVFFSLRPIASGEELTIDYLNGRIIEENEDDVASSTDENEAPNGEAAKLERVPSDASSTETIKKFRPNSNVNKETCICKCGAKQCRKYIF
ncbi:histone-lysine N-methyltransferase SUV39H1-A [Culicoides brevitarsis]|uniref:histone-lysine N-methyltransferase SUV39H1-A n=1 Tax=Culicoides brevitarsis TaxID=469753 RepID=UPI00307BE914